MSDLLGASTLYRTYKKLRAQLERVPVLRSAIHQMVEIKNTLNDNRNAAGTSLDQIFEREDPYGFDRPEEAVRFERALEMLDAVRGEDDFGRAFEIGCAEGKFTAMVAPLCR